MWPSNITTLLYVGLLHCAKEIIRASADVGLQSHHTGLRLAMAPFDRPLPQNLGSPANDADYT